MFITANITKLTQNRDLIRDNNSYVYIYNMPVSLSYSSEFLGLMKKVSKSPMVTDVLNIPGVQRSLERLADLLGKIQKALGEYLERERTSFPR